MGRNQRSITPFSPPMVERSADPYVKGDDVGHGVDHDCDNCRAKRRALAGDVSALGMPMGNAGTTEPAAGTESDGRVNTALTPAAVSQGKPASKDPERDSWGERQPEPPDSKVIWGELISAIDLARPAGDHHVASVVASRTVEESKLWTLLERATAQVLMGAQPEDEDVRLIGGGLAAIDTCIEMLGAKAMLNNGYVPRDTRWHVELDFGGSRYYAAHPVRDVAICLAVLKRFDPANALHFERALTKTDGAT